MINKHLIIASLLLTVSACQTSPDLGTSKEMTLNGTWHIEAVQGQPVVDYSPAQLVFADKGVLSGNNSCNQFFGKYKRDGNKLTLTPVGSTMKACLNALMLQEHRVMQAMTKVTTLNKSQGKLLLNDAQGKPQLVLSK